MTVRRSAIRSKRSKKRKEHRLKIMAGIGLVVLVLIIGGLFWVMHNEKILIGSIQIEGAQSVDTEDIIKLAEENISGSYLWIFPKKNILIFPKNQLRSEILDKYKQIKNVVVSRSGLKTVIISISEREPFALWCDGRAPTSKESVDVGNCYFVDSEGYIFTTAPYFHDHVYFELYGKPFLKNTEVVEETEPAYTKDHSVAKEEEKPAVAESFGETNPAVAESSGEAKEELNAKNTDEMEYIGTHFLPPAEFARAMQFISALEKIEIQVHSLIIDSRDMYKLSLISGGVLRFLPTQDHHRAVDDLATAYKEKFSDDSGLLLKDIEYIDIRFDNKVLFKFKD